MIFDMVTIKQGKTHCGRGLIIAVTEADGVEFIEMHEPLTSNYGSRVQLATYMLTAILLVVSLLDSPK